MDGSHTIKPKRPTGYTRFQPMCHQSIALTKIVGYIHNWPIFIAGRREVADCEYRPTFMRASSVTAVVGKLPVSGWAVFEREADRQEAGDDVGVCCCMWRCASLETV